jgi:hypothetical protein
MPRRKCKGCNEYTIPAGTNSRIKWCSDTCLDLVVKLAYEKQRQLKEKSLRKQKSEAVKKSQQTDVRIRKQAAVKACHQYIHLRDAGRPCISCGAALTGRADAGHYISAGSCTALRFDERNIHLQCVRCNMFLSGNLRAYREGLIQKIGLDQVLDLESTQPLVKTSAAWYKEIELKYRDKIKDFSLKSSPNKLSD